MRLSLRRGRRPAHGADLAAVVRSATDAILTADDSGRILTWNPAAERVFGHPAEAVVGKPITILMPERYRGAHEAGLSRVSQTGETRVIGRTVELEGLRADGSEFPIELSLSTWEDGGRRYFAGIIRDVSERAHLLRELQASEGTLNAVLRSAVDAVVCVDQDGRIVVWNPAAERLLGHTEAEALGAPITTIIPEDYREAHEAGFARALAGGPPRLIGRTAEVTALRADGSRIPVELSLSTWSTEGGRFFGAFIRDIQARKEAEEALQRAKEAVEEKNRELKALSAKLAKYLSRNLYESIFEGRTEVRLASYRKKVTIFFSDIAGFTELTDRMEAERLTELLNGYLSDMARIAEEFGGTLDKFIGDGIMIFFGDPDTRGEREDALACVEMALAMRSRIWELQGEWERLGVPEHLHVRMGISTGFATVGNFGSEDRLDYTIVGGHVNAASRLEQRAGRDEILISETTHALVKDCILAEPVGAIEVKGIARPIRAFRILGRRDGSRPELRPVHEEREGFRLVLDPALLTAGDVEGARQALRRALLALEGSGGGPASASEGAPGDGSLPVEDAEGP